MISPDDDPEHHDDWFDIPDPTPQFPIWVMFFTGLTTFALGMLPWKQTGHYVEWGYRSDGRFTAALGLLLAYVAYASIGDFYSLGQRRAAIAISVALTGFSLILWREATGETEPRYGLIGTAYCGIIALIISIRIKPNN